MPGYQAHTLGGVLVGAAAASAAVYFGYYTVEQWPFLCALLGVCMLGALFPDIDTDSRGQNLFYGGMLLLDLAFIVKGMYKWAAFLGFFAIMPGLGHHRGWTHTWWAMLLVPAPILLIPMAVNLPEMYVSYTLSMAEPWMDFVPFYAAFALGYFSHLAMDRKFF